MKPLLIPVLVFSLLAVHAADLPEPRFRAVNVDTNIAIGFGLALADVDGDRKPDILLADKARWSGTGIPAGRSSSWPRS